jgi:hypothetical protein
MLSLRGFFSRLFSASKADDTAGGGTAEPGDQIDGVVCQSGARRVETGSGPRLHFTFDTWRGADGITRTTPLTIRRACAERELRALMARIQPYSVISARVRLKAADQAELLEVVNVTLPSDDVLFQRSVQLRTPVTRLDAQFGTLTLHREPGWNRYLGRVEWCGETVWLDAGAGDDEEPDPEALDVARALWSNQHGWDARVRDFIARELLDEKNEHWLDDGEPPVTEDEIKARVRLVTILVYAGGGYTLWFNDDDLLGDHTIEVTGTLADGPTDTMIQG